MPKQTTKHAFRAAFSTGDLAAQVAIARATALHLIANGGIESDPHDFVNEIAGGSYDQELSIAGNSGMWEAYGCHIQAALALGIALGQLVHPDVFKTGGAR